uniref:Phosphatidic acid phosphatase type 2/haloperoxidase domain-containing protein n=1 Tax=Glossina palpalis gambiensis TaxID=67801 RepID=A0A1B0AYG2_9MUSC
MSKMCLMKIILNLIILGILLGIVFNYDKLWGPPTQRGFFCEDNTLRYPYHPSTISTNVMYIIGLYAPLIVLMLWIFLKHLRKGKKRLKWSKFLLELYTTEVWFLFGFTIEHLFKNVGKYAIGRLRPHFITLCQPQLADGSSCADPKNVGIFVQVYTCKNTANYVTAELLNYAHFSFPSGHSSLAFYSMVYLVLYIQQQKQLQSHQCFVRQQSKAAVFDLILPTVQLVCLLLAWFIALSRVFDYKHHWSDCLAGALLGSSVAAAISYCCRKQHIKKSVDVLPLLESNVNQTQSNTMSSHMGAV